MAPRRTISGSDDESRPNRRLRPLHEDIRSSLPTPSEVTAGNTECLNARTHCRHSAHLRVVIVGLEQASTPSKNHTSPVRASNRFLEQISVSGFFRQTFTYPRVDGSDKTD